jgi:hypothetical protein
MESALREDRKQAEASTKDLNALYQELTRTGLTPEVRSTLGSHIREARERAYVMRQKLAYVATLNDKLKEFDLGLFHSLKLHFDALPEAAKGKARKEIDRQRAKVFDELSIAKLTATTSQLLTDFDAALQMADGDASRGELERTKEWLRRAVGYDRSLDKALGRLQATEHQLLVLIPKRIEKMR